MRAQRRSVTEPAAKQLRLGVVGNRDLGNADIEVLERSVLQFLVKLREAARIESPSLSQIVIVNSLAEGSDQLVARVAVDQRLGFALLCPVPFTVDEYKDLFTIDRARSVAAFDRLLEDPEAHTVVIELGGSVAESGRDAAYAAAAERLLSESHLLLAIYDSAREGAVGGSLHTVDKALLAGLPVVRINPRVPERLEYWAKGKFVAMTDDALRQIVGDVT